MFARLASHAGIPLRYANRHGLITGPTGTGKTVSLMRIAEQFSKQGVPVFLADVKSDIAALSRSCPAEILDLFGQAGKPLSASVASFGADLMARALDLSDAQAGALEIAFAFAADRRLPLNTLADLRACLAAVLAERESVSIAYGQVSSASVGVIQRALLRLETQGAARFFGSPAFDVAELLEPSRVSILAADKLMSAPRVYSAFLLWLLAELYNRLPEIGDQDRPRLVFFFDESHLLFQDCPLPLLRRIEQTVRLIRSKGVGVFFVSQSAGDVPQLVREQLATRIEHDRTLPVGVARFQSIDASGRPTPILTVKADLPTCQLGALSETEARQFVPETTARPAERASVPRWFEIALYGICAALIIALLGFVVWAAQTGRLGVCVAFVVGAWLALRGRIAAALR
ncbi:helicase HerA-like domain-containing protein [Mesorhizobium sp.]|uniref:helicase HerA-like domain-containing protein n=1 Tax=Mesorhizobium sp. TaxID=1871066 RepID=UPI0025BB1113|nr:helicase HerA-like domain-containing protein [Mesorhizobium sp.]